jgi:ketosteroid isomerase-like protein
MPAQTPEQCDELFGRYLNSRDLDNLVALYEPQASLGNEDGTVSRGTAAIRETMQGLFAALPEGKITMNVVRTVRAGDDLAVLYNDWSVVGRAANGSPVEIKHRRWKLCVVSLTVLGGSRLMIRTLAAKAAAVLGRNGSHSLQCTSGPRTEIYLRPPLRLRRSSRRVAAHHWRRLRHARCTLNGSLRFDAPCRLRGRRLPGTFSPHTLDSLIRVDSHAGYFEPQPLPDCTWDF